MTSSIEEYDLTSVFETERKLLTFSGFYKRKDNERQIMAIFSAFLNLLFSYLQLLSMIAQLLIEKNDLSKMTDTLLFFMTHSTFLCKLSNFIYYRGDILLVEDTLKEEIFYSFPRKYLQFLTQKVDSCKLVAKIFRVLCVLCILMYAVTSYLGDKKLPLPGWLPYDTNIYYHHTVVFQMISVTISAYNNSSIDILTWKLITIASGEFEILKEDLKDISYKFEGKKELKIIEIRFKNCVKLHVAVINFVSTIELIFSKGIFLQFFASVVVICVTGFQMVVVPIASLQFLLLLMYFSCMMCQVAMYCWYGHDVMMTSDEIGKYCYMSNWYDSALEIRKSIIIFMERTKKPTFVTAGKFVTLSLTTFTAILRSSYSYFAVLQRLYTEDA